MRVLSSRSVYQGKIIGVKVDRIVEPGGVEAIREVVCHPGSVVVLPRFASNRVLLVRQFRYPALRRLWELVAGGIEKGEAPQRAAARELAEETGYRAARFKLLFKFYSSPGFLNETMALYEARGLKPGAPQLESDERIETALFSVRELREMVRRGKIQDGKTLVGLLWLFMQARRE
jgi:ADP-ribose pyrophosphatase